MSINKKIVKYLEEKGISHSVLVKKTGISKQNLSRILGASDDLKVSQLLDICKALNLPPTYFFDVVENQNANLIKRIEELEEIIEDKKFRIRVYDRVDQERIIKWANELIDEHYSYFTKKQRDIAVKFALGARVGGFGDRRFFDENAISKLSAFEAITFEEAKELIPLTILVLSNLL